MAQDLPQYAITTSAARARKRLTVALWTTNLSSVIASNLTYIYLASFIYRQTGRIEWSNITLMCPMAIPVVACFGIASITRRSGPRRIFAVANGCALGITLLLLLVLGHYPLAALAGATLIGVVDALQRVTRIVALKAFYPDGDVKTAVPIALSAQFIAGGLAGVLMGLAPNEAAPAVVLPWIGALFALAGAVSLLLPVVPTQHASTVEANSSVSKLLGALDAHPEMRGHFVRVVMFIGVFQGFYNLSRVALPAHLLNLSDHYVGLLQLLSSAAMLVGASCFYASARRGWRFAGRREAALIGICIGASTMAVTLHSPALNFALYFVYILAFEIMFLQCQADLVEACPREHVGTMAAYQYAAMYVAMMVIMGLGSVAVPFIGLNGVALACGVLYVLLYARTRSRPKPA
ncbi:MFS transporter [Caballeronia sp. SEWSISQ10-4 2]|uniref:MFS transporter n=1 Tax=Caballeronia sp. SEWSISQ10-4 2 TaxID=2937438 RepID=UPI00346239E6